MADPNGNNNNNNVPEIRNANNNNVFITPNSTAGQYWMQKGFLGKCGTEIRKSVSVAGSLFKKFRDDGTVVETTLERKILCIVGFYQLTIKGHFKNGIKWDFLRQKTYYDKKGREDPYSSSGFNDSFKDLVGRGDQHEWFTVSNMDKEDQYGVKIVKLKPAGEVEFNRDAVALRNEWLPDQYREFFSHAVDSENSEFSNQIFNLSERPTTNTELCHRLCAFYCTSPRAQKTLIFLYNNPGYQEGRIIQSHGWYERPAANQVARKGDIHSGVQRNITYKRSLGNVTEITDKIAYTNGDGFEDYKLRIKKNCWIVLPEGYGYENGMD